MPLTFPKHKHINNTLSLNERMIVKALKGMYGQHRDNVNIAMDILEYIIYRPPEGTLSISCKIQSFRKILLKSRNWEIHQWERSTNQRFSKALSNMLIQKEDFFESYLRLHIADVIDIKINDEVNERYYNIFNLDVPLTYEENIFLSIINRRKIK